MLHGLCVLADPDDIIRACGHSLELGDGSLAAIQQPDDRTKGDAMSLEMP